MNHTEINQMREISCINPKHSKLYYIDGRRDSNIKIKTVFGMEWWQENEAKRLVPVLAFDPLDLVHLVNDGRDKFFECLEVHILRQVVKNIGEVDARVLVHHFDEHLLEDGPAEFAGFVGQMGCSIRVE